MAPHSIEGSGAQRILHRESHMQRTTNHLTLPAILLAASLSVATVAGAKLAIKTEIASGTIARITTHDLSLAKGTTCNPAPTRKALSGYNAGDQVTLRLLRTPDGQTLCVEIAHGLGTLHGASPATPKQQTTDR